MDVSIKSSSEARASPSTDRLDASCDRQYSASDQNDDLERSSVNEKSSQMISTSQDSVSPRLKRHTLDGKTCDSVLKEFLENRTVSEFRLSFPYTEIERNVQVAGSSSPTASATDLTSKNSPKGGLARLNGEKEPVPRR